MERERVREHERKEGRKEKIKDRVDSVGMEQGCSDSTALGRDD